MLGLERLGQQRQDLGERDTLGATVLVDAAQVNTVQFAARQQLVHMRPGDAEHPRRLGDCDPLTFNSLVHSLSIPHNFDNVDDSHC